MQVDLTREKDDHIADLVMKSTANVFWTCLDCKRAHAFAGIPRPVFTLVGIGALSKSD
jgi:hypothetical protein